MKKDENPNGRLVCDEEVVRLFALEAAAAIAQAGLDAIAATFAAPSVDGFEAAPPERSPRRSPKPRR